MIASRIQIVRLGWLFAALLLLAACVGAQSGQSSADSLATVSGRAVFVAGPCGTQAQNAAACTASAQAAAGVELAIRQADSAKIVASFTTGDDGKFSLKIAPGVYRITLLKSSLHLRFEGFFLRLQKQEFHNLEINIELLRS